MRTETAGLGDPIDRSDLVDVPEIRQLAELSPEIPVLIEIERLIEADVLTEQGQLEECRMDWNVIFDQQTCGIVGLVENPDGFPVAVGRLASALHAGIGESLVVGKGQGVDQSLDMLGKEPIIVIEKDGISASRRVQSEIRGRGTTEWPSSRCHAQSKGPASISRGETSVTRDIDEDDLDRRVGLSGDRGEGVAQLGAIGAAHDD